MNTLWIVVIAAVVIYLAYNFYAQRIDRDVIQADAKRATPARMYMDGVDFMPTSRNVLYGYHFKSIAAAGPIVGVITAANLWGWLPALLWLMIGVSFIGWVSDYSAIMVAVRNDGNSLSAISHKSDRAPHPHDPVHVHLLLPAAGRRRLHGHHGRAAGRPPGRALRHHHARHHGLSGRPDALQVEDGPDRGDADRRRRHRGGHDPWPGRRHDRC